MGRAVGVFLRFWNSGNVRATIYQWGLVVLVISLVGWVVDTSAENLERLGITTGFSFLTDEAGFSISPAMLDYSPQSTYGKAIVVALLNTIVLSVIGIILATILGFFIAISRLSQNWLLRKLSSGYVETFRNVPLLLQLFFWYFAALRLLPEKRQSVNFFDAAFLNVEGFVVPSPVAEPGLGAVGIILAIALIAAYAVRRWAKQRQTRTGETFPSWSVGLAIVIVIPFIAAWVQEFPLSWNIPKFGRFNFQGGVTLSPEFVAMLFALTLYNGAFVGEIIRAGIMSVHKGQREAANSIGMRPGQIYSQIIIPQAMRLIVPPLTNQYLNLTKSTALAMAIGYADLFWAIGGAIESQTGQVLELQAITLGLYLSLSLFIALIMNWYNYATRIPER